MHNKARLNIIFTLSGRALLVKLEVQAEAKSYGSWNLPLFRLQEPCIGLES